jgi:hypothetical protein
VFTGSKKAMFLVDELMVEGVARDVGTDRVLADRCAAVSPVIDCGDDCREDSFTLTLENLPSRVCVDHPVAA